MAEREQVQVKEYLIKNGDREIYGMLCVPAGEVKAAVIMSHGYNGSHTHFDREGRAFAEQGYLAYAYDFCGGSAEGKSKGLATTQMTLFTEKEDLIAVFRAIGSLACVKDKKIFLLGGSQGGMVSALAAAELKDEVTGMILYFPALMIAENWLLQYPEVEDIPEVTDFWGMQLGKVFFTSMRDLKVYDVIGAYTNPVIIIHGDQDPIVAMGVVDKAAKVYQDVDLVVLEGEGHGFSPEGTETAISLVLDFVAGLI